LLCPLDRTVFGPLSKEYNTQCSSFVSANPVNTVDKKTWPKLFTSAFDQSVNPANIISEFRSCGILPFNPLAVPSEAFNPSMTFENQHTESSNHPMSWVTDKVNDLSTKMNYTLHDELTENGTDISEIVTENEATPDIQNIDPLICGENQVTNESRVLQEILINTPANTDTPSLLCRGSYWTSDTELPTSSLDWDFTVSNVFKIPSPPAKKKVSKLQFVAL